MALLKGLCRCFLRSTLFFAVVVAVVLLVPNLPPYCSISESYTLPKVSPLVGPLAINERLKDTEVLFKGQLEGPEGFAEYNGELYTTLHSGEVVKLSGNKIIPVVKTGRPCKGYYQEKICGRPLGMHFDKNGFLIVADAYYGIQKINIKTGQKEVLVSPDKEINGKKPKLFNSVALAHNGDIYWTDSSSENDLQNLVIDILVDPSGRLIHYDAKTKTNKVLIDKIAFANGVHLSSDESFVIVAETMRSRVFRYYLKGPKKGTHDVFIDRLPGLPDNIQSDGNDGFLIPLIETIDEEHPHIMQMFMPFPLARKFVARLIGITDLAFETLNRHYPTEFGEKAQYYVGHYRSLRALKIEHAPKIILHISKDGKIIENLSTTSKHIRGICEAFIFKDHMYFGSPLNDYVGRISLSALGWETAKVKRSPPVDEPKQAPKVETTPPPPKTTQPPPKQTTPPPPKQTAPPPKPQTTPPPKPQTTPPPKPKQETPPPKQQTPPPQQQTPPPTKPTAAPATKPTTPPPTKATTPQPKQQTPPAPKPTTAPPKQQTPPPQQQTPPKPTTPPPKQATPAPKQETPPPRQESAAPKQQPKVKESRGRNEL